MPTLDDKSMRKFIFLLGKVIADIPVKIIYENSEYQVEITEPPEVDMSGMSKISVKVLVKPVIMNL